MKYLALILLTLISTAVLAQQPKSKPSQAKKPVATKAKPTPTPTPLSEKESYDKASAYELASERVAALEKFMTDFPASERKPKAADLLTSSRVLIAEEKLLSGDAAGAAELLKRAVEEAPQPIPDELFKESIVRIPSTLFFRGQRGAAIQIANVIEARIETNASQLLQLADFYIGTENGAEAMRLAAKAAARAPESPAVYRTIALAHRINFDLDLSADAYAKSLELDPTSVPAKRGLAEMKRALGKSDEAATLYRELLSKDESDLHARTGLVLALFESGKRAEAESELTKALEKTPGNVILLGGAAYWYAANGMGDKAIELAQKAIEKEPRYVWSHIALARGLLAKNKPVAAEQALIKARAYGNFPTLEYEMASARAAAGFYREAAEDLSRHFRVTPGGVKTNLGGRVSREERSLTDLVAFERRASTFAHKAADTPENAEILRALLQFEQALQNESINETELMAAVDAFTAGSDKMRLHRQIYAGSALLQKKIAFGKVVELARAATANVDAGLEVPDAAAAVMASELYEPRSTAFRRNDYLLVPEVPKPTLSAIVRGRIEELAGWSLYQQNNFSDATIRLRRAISVLPANSAWWRSSMWRLGASLAAEGKDADALNAYIESYRTDRPDFAKYSVVEALYRKVNGSIDGLEAKIGRDRMPDVAIAPPGQPSETPAPATSDSSVPAASNGSSTSNTPPATELKPEPPKTDTSESTVKPEPPKTETSESTVKPETSKPVETAPAEPKPEPSATPKTVDDSAAATVVKAIEVKSEPPVDKIPENPPAEEQKTDRPASEKTVTSSTKTSVAKPLFEPIIITIPNRSSRTATKPADEKKDNPDAKPADTVASSAQPEIPPCKIGVSQDNLSVLNDGGTVGLLVSLEGGDIKTMSATSSSTKDVEITLEPEIVGLPDRRFYVIKSVSTAVGMYQLVFAAPCGRKEVVVTVR